MSLTLSVFLTKTLRRNCSTLQIEEPAQQDQWNLFQFMKNNNKLIYIRKSEMDEEVDATLNEATERKAFAAPAAFRRVRHGKLCPNH